MNADRLLTHYHRIADAPDAITRLRRFILDLAVRGKLVPQDPKDEPASELLKRIAAEKARLVKAGDIRKGNPLLPISADELPFELPSGWAWARLGGLIHLVSGQHLQPPEYSDDPKAGLPYITGPSDFGDDGLQISRFALVRKAVAKKGQLLLTVKGSGVGKTTTCDIPEVAISRQLMALTAIEWNARFLVLITHRLAEKLQEEARSLIPGISREDVEEFVFPLPPLAEQRRIVAKVDELMALCDRLESARAERETTRDRLAAASLTRLNTPDPDTFHDDARFALNALPAITKRPDQIKQLRQTILNLAVRGKLVPQDSRDEPAARLLKRIGSGWSEDAYKMRLYDESATNDSDGEPCRVSTGWEWALVEHCFNVSGGIQKTPARTPKGNAFPYLGVGNVYRGRLELANVKQFELVEGELERLRLHPGDILVVEGNGSPNEIGRCAVWNGEIENCVHQNHLIRCRPRLLDLTQYTALYLNSPDGMAEMKRLAITSAGLFSLSVGKIRKIPLPLPPLSEQRRIVAKVDELMALCDRMEASLATGDDTRRRLLDALLAEALTYQDSERESSHLGQN